MKTIFAILAASWLGVGATAGETLPVTVDVKENSAMTIRGTTNIAKFKLYQHGDSFIKKKMVITATQEDDRLFLSENLLEVPVKRFDSDNKMALRDFNKLMRSDEYPAISVRLRYFEMLEAGAGFAGNAIIDLTITGVTKEYTFPVKVTRDGANYIFNVNKDVNIRDFGLSPPARIIHLIKVNEWINVDLTVVCDIRPAAQD